MENDTKKSMKKMVKKDAKLIKKGIKKIDEPFKILKYVLMTEKSVGMIETRNKLVFIVSRISKKSDIKAAIETVFESKVSGVTTLIDQHARKKAFVTFRDAGAAGEIAIRLGII